VTEQEKTLLAGCVTGDKAAWDAFVRQYSGLIYHTIKSTAALYRAETSQDFADDLFQEIFLSLVKDDFLQLRRFRGDRGCTLASWLRMIAARRTISQLRKGYRPASPLEVSLSTKSPKNRKVKKSTTKSNDWVARSPSSNPKSESSSIFFIGKTCRLKTSPRFSIFPSARYTQKSRVLAKLREALEKPGAL
jgi:RNA polymerase sigma factor (sigma-70 family)